MVLFPLLPSHCESASTWGTVLHINQDRGSFAPSCHRKVKAKSCSCFAKFPVQFFGVYGWVDRALTRQCRKRRSWSGLLPCSGTNYLPADDLEVTSVVAFFPRLLSRPEGLTSFIDRAEDRSGILLWSFFPLSCISWRFIIICRWPAAQHIYIEIEHGDNLRS